MSLDGKKLIEEVKFYKERQYKLPVGTKNKPGERNGIVLGCLTEILKNEHSRYQLHHGGKVYCVKKNYECPLQTPCPIQREDTNKKPECLAAQWLKAFYDNR